MCRTEWVCEQTLRTCYRDHTLLMPPTERVIGQKPLLKGIQRGMESLSVLKLCPRPAGEGHMPPLLEGKIFGTEKNRKGIYRVPGTVHPHGSQLGRPVITAAVFDPLHID